MRINTFLLHFLLLQRFWVNHNMIQIARLLPMLRDIKRFLDSTTDEIVVLDIHQLPVGFYESDNSMIVQRHEELLVLLMKELGGHISDFGRTIRDSREIVGPTVSAIVKSGKRLIIGYPEKSVTNINKWLWKNVKHMWGNTNDPYKLKNYLDAVMSDPYRPTAPGSNPLWSAMAQTTPTALDIASSGSSLRRNADAINRNLTSWVSYDWTSRVNIVSSDFFLGNDLIDALIYLNKLKAGL